MTLNIDHISYASRDLVRAKHFFSERFGLDAVEGGSHPAWGTANLIVPLGIHFIEIVGVVDPLVAADNPVGQLVTARSSGGDRPLGLCLRADDLDSEAARLGLPLLPGERRYADGRVLRWRQLGIAEAIASPGLPYFFAYDDEQLRLGSRPARHRVAPKRIVAAAVSTDRARFASWVGDAALPITIVDGVDGLVSIDIELEGGSIIHVGSDVDARRPEDR